MTLTVCHEQGNYSKKKSYYMFHVFSYYKNPPKQRSLRGYLFVRPAQ